MSNPLYSFIAREAAQHPLTIARYMEWALQHPDYGYYRQRDPLGRGGDFITAPEVSQMFGELIGLWCVDCWAQLGRPKEFLLLELGPGRGTLMADALRAAAKYPDFIAAMRLALLESAAPLREWQQEKLGRYHPTWREDLSALPPVPTLIIANEFFDALPVRQFVRRTTAWFERCIGVEEGRLGWVEVAAPQAAALLSVEQQTLAVGATAEICPLASAIMQRCAAQIVQHGGAALIFDYGYELPPGTPSFQAVARHEFTDPLANPGVADLTAHVDFIALERAAQTAGAQIWQVQAQGELLQRLGLPQRAAQLAQRADAETQAEIQTAYRRLTADDAMGKLFKALCVTRDTNLIPAGWMLE